MNQNKKNIYGFEVTNVAGQGFRRWFNSPTTKFGLTDKLQLPDELERVCSAQSYMGSFSKAYNYTYLRSKALDFDFKTLTEEDFKRSQGKIKRLFNKLFSKK